MGDPQTAASGLAALLAELSAFGVAIGFSPIHIGVLLLLLLGPKPLQRGGWFVLGWLATAVLAVTLLLSLGHGLLLTMDKGSSHRTGLDLLAAGALLGLGLKELLNTKEETGPPGWTSKLEKFCAMPLPLLIGLSGLLEVASPDDLFLFAKSAGSLLSANLGKGQELLATGLFSLVSGSLLITPLLVLVVLGKDRCQPLLEKAKSWLFAKGDLLVGLVSVALAGYLGWQGIGGLQI
ncbi:GAP family protein [Cyanobium sp. WAJ14-Wanaka]|uniref:GAP family protein n=1 Tax=Cyanobium sp. WAJ14-Wanaka TaxID=2823725 RepID=UPI0020CDD30B|nr:GAP family protein [Cyanobium sp. WAJ14-Wanaka]MCP9774210.1 GAP family protein [Cyanobium sp. WAJ14-Wanaka]